jgi:RNA polymerase sigma-70 factor (ECF subfamily)
MASYGDVFRDIPTYDRDLPDIANRASRRAARSSPVKVSRSAALPASDEALMVEIGTGDTNAFKTLMNRHLGRTVRIAARLLDTPNDAEEIAQEAFLRVWRSAASWRPIGAGGSASFSTWLHRIVLNLVIDLKRRKAPLQLDETYDAVDETDDSFAQLSGRQLAQTVSAAIGRLPERQRIALTLCFFEGMSNAEASALLGASIKGVESLLVRARCRLKAELKAAYDEL